MNTNRLVVLLTTVGILSICTGCATQTADFRSAYSNSLHAALAQIESGRPSEAVMSLKSAQVVAAEHGYDKTPVERLAVEVNLARGNTVVAFDQAKALLDANPQDPYANELMGKCLLKGAEFKEADGHFTAAQQAYRAPADIARAQDFVAVTRYLLAYANGNVRLAEEHLRKVQNPDLLRSIDRSREEVEVAQAR